MPIIREPQPLPSDLSYVPPGTKPYKVSDKDSWWVLADLPDVRGAGLSANDLCYLNFKTRKPSEINWYLHHKVGCRTTTAEGNNYRFSSGDQPGIVHLPIPGPPNSVNDFPPVKRKNIWVGLGVSTGTQFVAAGIETMVGSVWSVDEFGKAMVIEASTSRLGLGLGASVGAVVILICGVDNPGRLSGYLDGGWDWNLSIGDKLDGVAKMTKFKPLIRVMMKFAATPKGLKKVLAHPNNWTDYAKLTLAAIDGIPIDSEEPSVIIIGIPFVGAGEEASVFFGVTSVNAYWDSP